MVFCCHSPCTRQPPRICTAALFFLIFRRIPINTQYGVISIIFQKSWIELQKEDRITRPPRVIHFPIFPQMM